MKISRINRFFNILLGALAMFAVALLSAFITMRLAIHGREVKVPNLTGLALSEASKQTRSLGLLLTLENRFYSPNTPPGHILAQSPAPGVTVRRQWAVRVTESLGAQQVAIPDVLGQSERTASVNIRRLGLELGAVAHIAAPGAPGVVIGQMIADAGETGVDVAAAEFLGRDDFAGGRTHQRRPGEEDGALVAHYDALVGHRGDVGAAGGA